LIAAALNNTSSYAALHVPMPAEGIRRSSSWLCRTGRAKHHQQSDATVAEKTHRELVELTVTCAQQSRITMARDVSEELWEMAKSYQRRAAALDEGKLPNIGDPPPNWTAHRD
jgi:hypothetical protein